MAAARRAFGEALLLGGIVGGGVWAIEVMEDWMEFAADLHERPERLHEEAERKCRAASDAIDRLADAGADFVLLASDVAFNAGPFLRPSHFAEFVTPYLARLLERVKRRGAFAFFHSDGMLMPVLDQVLSTQPHLLHSIDPMAGMDIAQVKRRTHGRMALMGNVQCSLLQEGPRERIRGSALYCLEHASPGGGYVFSTSNTVFAGMPLENYEYMLEVFGEFNARKRGGPGC